MTNVSISREPSNASSMFANRSFQRTVKVLRRILPTLSFGLLAAVYTISALAAGMFLSRHLVEFGTFGYWLAFGIGFGIQMVRGAIVFFSQLNPGRPQFGANWGPAIAVIMAVASIIEIYMLSSDLGLLLAPVISLGILMAAGLVIELFLLREVQYATQMELFRDQDRWDELRQFYVARADFEAMMDELEEGHLLPAQQRSASPTLPAGAKRTLQELRQKHEEILKMDPDEDKTPIDILQEARERDIDEAYKEAVDGIEKGRKSKSEKAQAILSVVRQKMEDMNVNEFMVNSTIEELSRKFGNDPEGMIDEVKRMARRYGVDIPVDAFELDKEEGVSVPFDIGSLNGNGNGNHKH